VKTRKVEWHFDAVDLRPVIRWLDERGEQTEDRAIKINPAGSSSEVEIYLDTEDRRFNRAGYSLRIRRTGRGKRARAEATLEELEAATTGPTGRAARPAVSEQLDENDPRLLTRSDGPVAVRVRAVAGRKKVRAQFEVRTRRRVLSLEGEGVPVGEIVLDELAIRPGAGGVATRLHRVEIGAPEAALATLRPFVERLQTACRLQPAKLTKYEVGALTGGLNPVPDAFGSTVIETDTPIGRVGLAVLRRQFAALLAREPGTRLGDDSEALHDMRVASRRLRAALSLFADVLPPSVANLIDDLRWIGHTLGAVRDLDVQLEQLEGWLSGIAETDSEALATVRALLESKRSTAREAMLDALDSRRYELFVGRFGRLLRSARGRRSGPASLPARAVAPDLIEERFRALRKAAEQIDGDALAADYHRVRIRGKRFRYALEFLADLYPERTQPLTKRVVALQDILGLHQDAEVAIERLRRLASEHGSELDPEAIFVMGEIAERYRGSAVELRARFPNAYARVTGKTWKAFAKLIEAERPAPAARAQPAHPPEDSATSDAHLPRAPRDPEAP
jgi:CHAD domain-containing protein